MIVALAAASASSLAAATSLRLSGCAGEDLAVRSALQNKLADVCVDMCKELGAYPEKCSCPDYVDTTDKTPGVVTWPELLEHMGNLKTWGQDTLKSWRSLSALQQRAIVAAHRNHLLQGSLQASDACARTDLRRRAQVQNRLSDVCVEMCKELGSYPDKCTCPDYVDTTDKTPGVMTWDELLARMSEIASNGRSAIKGWRSQV